MPRAYDGSGSILGSRSEAALKDHWIVRPTEAQLAVDRYHRYAIAISARQFGRRIHVDRFQRKAVLPASLLQHLPRYLAKVAALPRVHDQVQVGAGGPASAEQVREHHHRFL